MSLGKTQDVLRIKKQREERAGVSLRRSLAAFTTAYQGYQQAEQALTAYVSTSQQEKDRLYADILGQAFRPSDIDRLNDEVDQIDARIGTLKEKVAAAQQGLLKAKASLAEAKSAYAVERRQFEKWKRLAEQAEKAQRRRDAHAAEIALDEMVCDRHTRHLASPQASPQEGSAA